MNVGWYMMMDEWDISHGECVIACLLLSPFLGPSSITSMYLFSLMENCVQFEITHVELKWISTCNFYVYIEYETCIWTWDCNLIMKLTFAIVLILKVELI
jgi:hypothetical protein